MTAADESGSSPGDGARAATRRFTATRLLADRLLHRAEEGAATNLPDEDAAFRLVDERLVPSRAARREVAHEALLLVRAALAARVAGGVLEGELHANLRVGLHREGGEARVVTVPTRIHHPDGTISVLTMAPEGDDLAERRAARYRSAAAILLGKRVTAFIAYADGTVVKLPPRRYGDRPRRRPGKRSASR